MHLIRNRVSNHRGVAEVTHMVRPAGLIEHQIPVQIALRPSVQITDHIPPVALPGEPFPQTHAALLAALSEQHMLIREKLMHLRHLIELLAAVPVDARPPHILRRFRI
ncbi:hypothetical protein D3C80_1844480 [compost metagenome]